MKIEVGTICECLGEGKNCLFVVCDVDSHSAGLLRWEDGYYHGHEGFSKLYQGETSKKMTRRLQRLARRSGLDYITTINKFCSVRFALLQNIDNLVLNIGFGEQISLQKILNKYDNYLEIRKNQTNAD